MPLSKRKQAKMELEERHQAVNRRSLNGKGYFMDAAAEIDAQKYIETGDVSYLDRLPDYRTFRGSQRGANTQTTGKTRKSRR